MSVSVSSGLSMTNFLVNLHTVPPLFACVMWDDATMIRHPMGKSTGEFESINDLVWMGACMCLAEGALDQASGSVAMLCVLEELGGERRHIQFLTVTFLVQYASLGQICQSGGRQVPCPI